MSSLTTTLKTNKVPSGAYLAHNDEPKPSEEKPVDKPAEEGTKSIRGRVQHLFA